MKAINLYEPYVDLSAGIEKDETGNIKSLSPEVIFDQIAKYIGKNLPFDGNNDYFSAKDYDGSYLSTSSSKGYKR